MLKPSAATAPGLPRLRDLADISHPATAVGQAANMERSEFLGGEAGVTPCSGMSVSKARAQRSSAIPQDFSCKRSPRRKQQVGDICQHQRQTRGWRCPVSKAVARRVGDSRSLFGCVTCSAPVATLTLCRLPPRSPLMSCRHLCPWAPRLHRHQHPPSAHEPGPLPTAAWARMPAGAGSVLAPASYYRSNVPVLARQVTLGQSHQPLLPSTQQPWSNLPLLPAAAPLTLFRLEA